MRKLLILVLLSVMLSGCTAHIIRSGRVINPIRRTIRRNKVFNKDFDEMWKTVVKACAETGISIKVIEKESGIITAERSLIATEELRETFETGHIILTYDKMGPAGLYGAANPAIVAKTGKAIDSKTVELDLLSELQRQGIFVIFSYNIYVEKSSVNETEVSVNIFAYPSQPKIKFSTSHVDPFTGERSRQEAEVDISQAKFASKGKFENNFLKLLDKLN